MTILLNYDIREVVTLHHDNVGPKVRGRLDDDKTVTDHRLRRRQAAMSEALRA